MADTPEDDARHAWENPGAHEVAPGIHRIPLPLPNDGLRAVNVYAVRDGDEYVLIDAGWALAESQELLARSLRAIGTELGAVREFLCTHLHRDHYTQAVTLRRQFGNRVAVGAGEQSCLDLILHPTGPPPDLARMTEAGAHDLVRTLAKTPMEHDESIWEYPDRWLADRQDIELTTRTLQVIATPGHTRGHVVFHDPANATLFAGDHVLPHITPSIGVELNRPPSPLRDYLTSLELVRALPDARLLPAHGPITDSVHDRIDELLRHHAERLDETEKAVRAGATSGYETARALGWTRRRRHYDEMDFFNQLLAVQETMAHLVVLVEQGRLRSEHVDGVARFLPA